MARQLEVEGRSAVGHRHPIHKPNVPLTDVDGARSSTAGRVQGMVGGIACCLAQLPQPRKTRHCAATGYDRTGTTVVTVDIPGRLEARDVARIQRTVLAR